jgi:hypothetical protein
MKFTWGHGIFIFMTIFVLLAAAFIVFSLRQTEDLVTDDYYEQGADYSSQIEVNKRSAVYYDSITVEQLDKNVEVKLSPSLVNPKDTVFMHFYKAADKKSDVKLKFIMDEKIIIPASELKNGRYQLKMMWKHLDSLYNIEKEITLK